MGLLDIFSNSVENIDDLNAMDTMPFGGRLVIRMEAAGGWI